MEIKLCKLIYGTFGTGFNPVPPIHSLQLEKAVTKSYFQVCTHLVTLKNFSTEFNSPHNKEQNLQSPLLFTVFSNWQKINGCIFHFLSFGRGCGTQKGDCTW